jgi:hypothetical protein
MWVLRRVFKTDKAEVTGGWIEMCNEELRRLNSPSVIRVIK